MESLIDELCYNVDKVNDDTDEQTTGDRLANADTSATANVFAPTSNILLTFGALLHEDDHGKAKILTDYDIPNKYGGFLKHGSCDFSFYRP